MSADVDSRKEVQAMFDSSDFVKEVRAMFDSPDSGKGVQMVSGAEEFGKVLQVEVSCSVVMAAAQYSVSTH